MKQSLQLRLSQQLAMTPQLQQAIRLLQLSTLELQQEIQQALESNPLLEQDDDQQDPVSDDTSHTENQSDSTTETTTENDVEEFDTLDALEQKEMPDDLPLDTQWEEIYTAGTPSGTSNDYMDDERPLYQGETTASLQDYLTWQADLTPFTETDRAIAISIIDAVDETGYLTVTTDDILLGMGDDEIELDEVEAVLKRIQRFDPIGVAARDLKECLLIQLSAFSTETPYLKETQLVISQYLELLGNRDFRQLMRQTKLREETLKSVIEIIQSLDPKPGLSIDTGESEYVIPDILVKKSGERWQVELNTDSIPRLRINETYAALGQSTQNESDGKFIRDNLQEAKWLIKSLESRNETLLKVAHCIVDTQQAFFELGEEHMKPLVLADIAEQVEMHESTISRVTTQKFLHCPRGIFELKYFFSSHVNTDSGGEASSTAIRALVKKLIAAENPAKPLSDSKLADMLAELGIQVARRTVAKYRESLSIPPSNQRKELV
ncbi:RNA polymerase factor sigma-54 [Proteus sp. G2659]|uniref:RNA polymerase factor sigma-54 n=1 Tax=Proteus sp. G2659 TaxID=2698872 RepID=UPI00137911A1|nr:RNA polymerase factor sigma-54 [Proteus sp. G2659]NBM79251.1 RNA polymerase factor sigma-54 [Proteus sp. G2659]